MPALKLLSMLYVTPLSVTVLLPGPPRWAAVIKYCGAMAVPLAAPCALSNNTCHCQPLLSSRRGSLGPPGVWLVPCLARLPGAVVLRWFEAYRITADARVAKPRITSSGRA